MIPSFVVGVVSDRHEIEKLCGVPVMEELRISSDEISTDEDVENTANECNLLAGRDKLCIIPSSSQPVNILAHLLPVSV